MIRTPYFITSTMEIHSSILSWRMTFLKRSRWLLWGHEWQKAGTESEKPARTEHMEVKQQLSSFSFPVPSANTIIPAQSNRLFPSLLGLCLPALLMGSFALGYTETREESRTTLQIFWLLIPTSTQTRGTHTNNLRARKAENRKHRQQSVVIFSCYSVKPKMYTVLLSL